jgi:diacylglycerol kinase (ATP)
MQDIRTKVIVNPEAGSWSVLRKWPYINRRLCEAGLLFDYEFTKSTGHALDIASRAVDNGYNYLIAIGGDGTINEVANGILRSSNSLNVKLGIVGVGTANAFSYSLGIPEDANNTNIYSFLTGQGRALIDVGVVKYWNRGQCIERFFLNEASTGFSAEIVDAWKSLPNRFGKRINIALREVASYKSLAVHQNKKVRLHIGSGVESISIFTIVVSNGQYCANKMLIAPHANLTDGLLNAIIVSNLSKYEMLKIRRRLYDGSHINYPKVREIKTKSITIESDKTLLVEADGEFLGECPASFRILPLALTVVVPPLHTP